MIHQGTERRQGRLSVDGAMRGLTRIHRTRLALLAFCGLGISGCSLDLVAVSFCASEQQSVGLDGASSLTSSQAAVSLAVGDSVRLVAHGFCRDARLHIAIATSTMRWRSHDPSIVRLSTVADRGGEAPAVWAIGVSAGETLVGAELNGSEGLVAVKVR